MTRGRWYDRGMARELTPGQITSALERYGVRYEVLPGAWDRCRCHTGAHQSGAGPTGLGWGPIYGLATHITAGAGYSGTTARNYALRLSRYGNGTVPGPLAQFWITADAEPVVLIAAAGRSNHLGRVSRRGVEAMRAASFSLAGYHNLRGAQVDGNRHAYGVEIMAPRAPSAAQRAVAVRLWAAIADQYGWTGQEVHGHGEVATSRTYADPGMDMGRFRRDVMAAVAAGGKSGGASGVSVTLEDGTVMAITNADARKIAKAVWDEKVPVYWHDGPRKVPARDAFNQSVNFLAFLSRGVSRGVSSVASRLRDVDRG